MLSFVYISILILHDLETIAISWISYEIINYCRKMQYTSTLQES